MICLINVLDQLIQGIGERDVSIYMISHQCGLIVSLNINPHLYWLQKGFHELKCFAMSLFASDKRSRVLDAEGLALGSEIASSKKRSRDLVDDSFHRCV